jgi:hypothetical protein
MVRITIKMIPVFFDNKKRIVRDPENLGRHPYEKGPQIFPIPSVA